MNKNRIAFLSMLAVSEGTAYVGKNKGYDVIVGSTPKKPILFTDYSDHPRRLIKINDELSSTAAGRYQILARIFDAYKKSLGLKDFSPASQDAIALELIRERKALELVDQGKFEKAVKLCNGCWASLPGAKYKQRTNEVATLVAAYKAAGGTIA